MELAKETSRQISKVLTTFFYLFMIRYRDELKEELFNFQTEFRGNIEDSGFKVWKFKYFSSLVFPTSKCFSKYE